MKKISLIILSLCLSYVAKAQGIKFMDNPTWANVVEQAKKEKKIIFLDAYTTWCGPCKQMDSDIYTDKGVADFYNANFINVKYDMEKGEGPMLADRFYVNAYPNLVFVSPEGTILHKAIGFKMTDEFLALGKEAQNPKSQYYTVKRNALKLNTSEFLAFARQATAFNDEDFRYLGQDYLAAQPDMLGDSNLVELTMNYISGLANEKDIAYLKENRTKVLREGKYSDDDFRNRLLSLVLEYALSEKVQLTDEVDFELVNSFLNKYVPDEAFMALNFYKTQYSIENEDYPAAASTLELMASSPDKVGYQQLCNAIVMFGTVLADKGLLDKPLSKFEAIKLPESQQELDFMKDFVKSIIYYKTNQTEKFKAVAPMVLNNKNTPEEVKKDIQAALDKMNSADSKP